MKFVVGEPHEKQEIYSERGFRLQIQHCPKGREILQETKMDCVGLKTSTKVVFAQYSLIFGRSSIYLNLSGFSCLFV